MIIKEVAEIDTEVLAEKLSDIELAEMIESMVDYLADPKALLVKLFWIFNRHLDDELLDSTIRTMEVMNSLGNDSGMITCADLELIRTDHGMRSWGDDSE